MLYVQPSATFNALLDGAATGLVGTVGVRIENSDGSTHTARTTSGIVEIEAGSGSYSVSGLVAPSDVGTYVLLWDTGGGTPSYATEELIVTGVVPATAGIAGEGLTLGEMVEQLNGLAGLDLSDAEAESLLNEGYIELVSRSEWLRANYTATTVADQEDYDLPADLYRILEVYKNGVPQNLISDVDVAQVRSGNSYLTYENYGQSVYWLEADSSGNDHLTLYPTPGGSGGDPIVIRYVRRPNELTSSEAPAVPREFQRGIIHYAAYLAYSMLEDDEGAAEIQYGRFERKVEELRQLRNSRSGRGTKRMVLQGVHWN